MLLRCVYGNVVLLLCGFDGIVGLISLIFVGGVLISVLVVNVSVRCGDSML